MSTKLLKEGILVSSFLEGWVLLWQPVNLVEDKLYTVEAWFAYLLGLLYNTLYSNASIALLLRCDLARILTE